MFGGTQLVDLLECFIFFRHNLASLLMKNGHQWDHVLNIYPMQDAKNSSWRVLVMDGVKLKAPPQTEFLQKIREVIQVGAGIFGMFSGGRCCAGRKTQIRSNRWNSSVLERAGWNHTPRVNQVHTFAHSLIIRSIERRSSKYQHDTITNLWETSFLSGKTKETKKRHTMQCRSQGYQGSLVSAAHKP